MANLPDEIIMIILSNLPVKSLVRFKCVSRSWRSWILNPKLELSNQRRHGAITMMKYKQNSRKTSSFRLINQQPPQQLTSEELNAPFMIRGGDDTPFFLRVFDDDYDVGESYRGTFRVLGSCHGLILICINNCIYLWNPATRFYNKLCELDIDFNLNNGYTRGGLCFDSSKNIYKALLIDGKFVNVVSLKENQKWRQVEFPYGDMRSICDGITLNGRIHYKVRINRDDSFYCIGLCNEIICFDPVAEKFHIFPVPDPKFDRLENIIVGVGALNECLYMSRLDNGAVEILVMKEYGVKESWISLFFIRNLEIDPFHGAVVPLFMTDNGEFILFINNNRDKNVLLYDPKNDNVQDIQLVHGRKEYISCSICYVESLISPQELLLE